LSRGKNDKIKKMKKIFLLLGYNTLTQLIGKIISTVFSLVSIGLLTRYLGQEGFGNYSLVFAYLSIFGILSDLGLQLTMVRELVQRKESSIYGAFFEAKLLLVIFATLFSWLFLLFFPYSSLLKIAILITSFGFALGSLNNFGTVIFQANLRLDLVTLVDVISRVVTVGFIIVFVSLGRGLYSILNTILLGNLAGSILTIFLLRKFIVFDFRLDLNLAKKIIRQSLPVGLISILALLYFKIDTLILSIFRGAREVGIYSLSYKVLENILVLWGYYMASVYPLLAKFSKEKTKYEEIFGKSLKMGLWGGVGVLIVGWIFAPLIIRILGGEEFREATFALRILLLSVPLFFANNLFYHAFLTINQCIGILIALTVSLILNIVLNLILIPRGGYVAASYVTILTEINIFILYFSTFFNKRNRIQ